MAKLYLGTQEISPLIYDIAPGIPREVDSLGAYGADAVQITTFRMPSNATRIQSGAMYGAFTRNHSLTSFDGRSLTQIGGVTNPRTDGVSAFQDAFLYCDSLVTVDFSNLLTIGQMAKNVFNCAFMGCTALVNADFGKLTSIWGQNASADDNTFRRAFYGCTSLTNVNFSNVTQASGACFREGFYECTSLKSIDFHSLTSAWGYAFGEAFFGCTSLESVDFSGLTTTSQAQYVKNSAFYRAFWRCTSLTSVTFDSLSMMDGGSVFKEAFYGCTSLTSLSFPSLTASSFGTSTSQFDNMLAQCSDVTVHFPAAIQSTIGSWSSVTNGFGGTNTTVLFDL